MRIVAPDATCAGPSEPRAPLGCVFRHDATRFACTACAAEFRSVRELAAHRRRAHWSLVFQDWYESSCACRALFTARLDAFAHSSRCDRAANQSASAVPLSAASTTRADADATTPLPAISLPRSGFPRPCPSCAALLLDAAAWTTHVHACATANATALIQRHLHAVPPVSTLTATATDPNDDDSQPPAPRANIDQLPSIHSNDDDDVLMDYDDSEFFDAICIPDEDADMLDGGDDGGDNGESPEPLPPTITNAPSASSRAATLSGTATHPWLLRFDGACRRNPGPAGAGAALTRPNGIVLWTHYRYIPDKKATNNVAEYEALLDGLHCAAHHGIKHLRVEGDSNLVIEQVKGVFACSAALRSRRDQVREILRHFETYSFRHIDCTLNRQADHLANQALDLLKTVSVCALSHTRDQDDISDAHVCWHWTTPDASSTDDATTPVPTLDATVPMDIDDHDPNDPMNTADDPASINAERDGGTVYPALRLGPSVVPERQKRLQVPWLPPREMQKLEKKVEVLGETFASRIRDAPDWFSAEGYITALTSELATLIRQSTAATMEPNEARPCERTTNKENRRARGTTPLQLALARAKHELQLIQPDASRKSVWKAARRVKRITQAQQRHALRRLFSTNERRCVEKILRDPPVATSSTSSSLPVPDDDRCAIDPADLFAYFQTQATAPANFDFDNEGGALFRSVLDELPRADQEAHLLEDEITRDEIEDQLSRISKSTAPGLDGITNAVYVRFKLQLLDALQAAFNACWQRNRVPGMWKAAFVRLIHKKGNRAVPSNWRPICLQQTVYKLYTAVLAARLQRWMDANARFTMSQKGFRAFNGCHEHNFVATCLHDQTRRLRKKLAIVWYDLRNAFGSLPREYLWRVLARLGMPPQFVARVRQLYVDASFTVEARDGTTDPVQLECGVYQGCPLSPYLFIAALIPLVRALHTLKDQHGIALAPGVTDCVSAYADDIKIFARSADGAKALHEIVVRFLSWTRMAANPAKCALLLTDGARGGDDAEERMTLSIEGETIPRLTGREGYVYLGVEDGLAHERRATCLRDSLKAASADVVRLLRSDLAPWQVVRAIKSHVLSRFDYVLRHLRPFLSLFDGFDKMLVRGVKRLCQLPQTATSEFLFSPTSAGGLGFLPLKELFAALQIVHALQMLHSKDANVRGIARHQALQVVRKRYALQPDHWSDREEKLLEEFFNGTLERSPFALAKKVSGDIASLWTDVRANLAKYGLKVGEAHGRRLQPLVSHTDKRLAPQQWASAIKTHMRLRHHKRWTTLVDQGKTARVHERAGSAFLTRPSGVYDASYAFAVRARLNQVDTRSALKRKRVVNNSRCRVSGCSELETLAHVLNHCRFGTDSVRARHAETLSLIKTSMESELTRPGRQHQRLLVDATVPEARDLVPSNDAADSSIGAAASSISHLRPDIQLYDDKSMEAVIVDLAVAFEDQSTDDAATSSSFARVKSAKIHKYEVIKQFLEFKGYTVHVAALVYGSLGSVDTGNFAVYTERLGLRKGAVRRLERSFSARHINFAHRMWRRHAIAHTTGLRLIGTNSMQQQDVRRASVEKQQHQRPAQRSRRTQAPRDRPSQQQQSQQPCQRRDPAPTPDPVPTPARRPEPALSSIRPQQGAPAQRRPAQQQRQQKKKPACRRRHATTPPTTSTARPTAATAPTTRSSAPTARPTTSLGRSRRTTNASSGATTRRSAPSKRAPMQHCAVLAPAQQQQRQQAGGIQTPQERSRDRGPHGPVGHAP